MTVIWWVAFLPAPRGFKHRQNSGRLESNSANGLASFLVWRNAKGFVFAEAGTKHQRRTSRSAPPDGEFSQSPRRDGLSLARAQEVWPGWKRPEGL